MSFYSLLENHDIIKMPFAIIWAQTSVSSTRGKALFAKLLSFRKLLTYISFTLNFAVICFVTSDFNINLMHKCFRFKENTSDFVSNKNNKENFQVFNYFWNEY
jgi:hypothetical protein